MRYCLVLSLLMFGCSYPQEASEAGSPDYANVPSIDLQNETVSGTPRYQYHTCDKTIDLRPPFEVVSTGSNDALAIPLTYIDDPSTKDRPPEGVGRQDRVEFGFPSKYRDHGMREWQALHGGGRFVKPLSTAAAYLQSTDAARLDSGHSNFQGIVDGHRLAMTCSSTGWPNPACDAEVDLENGGFRFLVTLPPKAVPKLSRIVRIGQNLFANAAGACLKADADQHSTAGSGS